MESYLKQPLFSSYCGRGRLARLLIFDRAKKQRFDTILPHRAIGVVYHPEQEKRGNYVPSVLSSRYDAFIYIDETTALHPLHIRPDGSQIPETYPFAY
jgi:erythromycin esterase